jgi:uncharacterized protein
MRFIVETWSPDYGTPAEAEQSAPAVPPDVAVELPPASWRPMRPEVSGAGDVLFVDGVRRVDANLWIEQPVALPALGLCATYAAGAVRCRDRAEIVGARVERGLFTSARGAEDVRTRHAVYGVKPTPASTPPDLWIAIQRQMAVLEIGVAADHAGAELVVVDGPLSHHQGVPGAVGLIKTQHVQYLPPELAGILVELPVGRRTPLFLVSGVRTMVSWYVRLAASRGPAGGIVRCEMAADRAVAEASRKADLVTATLPRFASSEHKDPRAPQNLYPIGGLERALRRRLGDHGLLYRSLRAAAAPVAAT